MEDYVISITVIVFICVMLGLAKVFDAKDQTKKKEGFDRVASANPVREPGKQVIEPRPRVTDDSNAGEATQNQDCKSCGAHVGHATVCPFCGRDL